MSPAHAPARTWRPPRQSALWLWACVSAGAHVALFLGFGARGAGLFSGTGVRWGDGFGGTSVELEIAGPDEGAPQGSISAGRAPEPEPALEEPSAPERESAPALQGELPVRAEPPAPPARAEEREPRRPSRRAREARDPAPPREASASGDPTAPRVAAPGEAPVAQGTGASDSTAGAPAGDVAGLILGSAGALGDSVAARRALLPNGGVCSDPLVGVWRAQKFRSSDRTWVRFLLRVRREGSELSGTITSRIWSGSPSDASPGTCTAFGFDHTWRMEARGHVEGTSVTFGSRSARLIRQDCPSSDARYAADNFTGTIEPLREVFESRNNDGMYDIDEPYTFRRVSCE